MDHFIEHFRLDVEISGDCTRETWYHSDPGNGVRRQKVIEEWKRQVRIGAGAGGEVFKERSNLGRVRAVKAIEKPKDSSDLSNLIKELVAMGQLSKDNDLFVELYGWYQCDQFLYLAMEYLELGPITKCYTKCMSESDVRVVAKQLLEGVARMHEKGIIHRDIKPQNILVFRTDPIWIKIADFGSSKVIQKNESGPSSLVGTEDFAAPEVLQLLDNAPETLEYTNAVDIWSVGCVLYYLLCRMLPFPKGRLYEYCKAKNPRFPYHHLRVKNVSCEGISLIRNLMAREPSQRMSASGALKTPWVTNEVILQKATEASDIYHWQGGPQAYPDHDIQVQLEQARRLLHHQTISINTPQHISSDSQTVPSQHYYYSGPIVLPAEHVPSGNSTVPLPNYYSNPPPAKHNPIGRPTIRDHRRDKRVVIGDMVHHHSFQQHDTTPALYSNQKADDSEGRSRASSEPREKPNHRSRKKDLEADANNHHDAELRRRPLLRYLNGLMRYSNEDLGADAKNHHDAELRRRPWLKYSNGLVRYSNEDIRTDANNHHDADLQRRPWLRYLNEGLGADANSHRDADLPRHFASGDDNSMTDWPTYLGMLTDGPPEPLAQLRAEQRLFDYYPSP